MKSFQASALRESLFSYRKGLAFGFASSSLTTDGKIDHLLKQRWKDFDLPDQQQIIDGAGIGNDHEVWVD
jgi:hypothetical protein